MKTFYITTTLPYVNAEPHIGFAYEMVAADALARYHESLGTEVFFNTGTDEHGVKVAERAAAEGKDPQTYVDERTKSFIRLKEILGLSDNLHFIRTTDAKHIKAAQELWKKCEKDIYKKKYKGLYCVGDEAFIKETDLVNGRCPNHPNLELQEIEEENYFFKLTNYKDYLSNYINNQTVIPERRLQEAREFVNSLEDFSISREKSRLQWGIPVPNDDTQVMYVWFDALVNYISTLGWPDEGGDFNKFWVEGETLQLAGKDQIRFQSIIWQAMLKSAGIKATDKVFYHGFITSAGQKMSKSLGNVINPQELVDKYGTEATRYLLIKHVHPYEDTDITWERLDEWYNAHLVNGIGNLVARIMKLAEDNIKGDTNWETHGYAFLGYPKEKIQEYRFDLVMDYAWDKIAELDREIQEKKPWESKDEEIIKNLSLNLYRVGKLLEPFLPETAGKIIAATIANKKPENLFPRLNA